MSGTGDERTGLVLSDRVIGAVGFLSLWDRFGLPPMLVVLAHSTGLSLAQAVQVLASYTLLYAVGQPLWGLLSDRLGRLPVLRIALVGVVVGAVASTLTATFVGLLVARGLAGLMMGCLYPTMLTLIGDTRHGSQRLRSLSSLQSWAALGNTFATLVAGTLAALVDWRLVFGLPALGALLLLWHLRAATAPRRSSSAASLGAALTPWALVLYLLAMVEGAVMMGVLAYVVPALQDQGVSVTLAGVLAATYGLGVIGGSAVMRRLAHRVTRVASILAGGTVLCLAFAAAWVWGTPAALCATALLIGVSNAVLHVSLQSWATEVAPGARATSVSLFAGSLFLGSSLASVMTADLADAGRYPLVFALSLVVSVVLTLAAALTYARFSTSR